MCEVNNTDPMEVLIHQTFHDLSDKFGIDVDTIADIINSYDEMVAPQLEKDILISKN